MGRARSLLAAMAAASALLLSTPSTSRADEVPLTADRIIYAEGQALWSVSSQGGEPTPLVSLLHEAAEVSRIKVAASGTAMLVSVAGYHAWADLTEHGAATSLHFLPCGGGLASSPDISPSGDRVLCATQVGKRVAVYQMRPTQDVHIIDRPAAGPLFFAGNDSLQVGFGKSAGLVTLVDGQTVAPHRPDRSMVLTPDGKRAVGGYNEGEIDVVYAFRLDGRATKRTLMQAARAVSISAGSTWACLQQEMDACAVRISGGQYMCWRRYEGIDISSDAHNLLVARTGESRGYDLFLGSISGTSARKPTPLVQSVERAAAFWPAPPGDPSDDADGADVPVADTPSTTDSQ